eukprot:14188137-Alexandrium_andersonii.AAC.1
MADAAQLYALFRRFRHQTTRHWEAVATGGAWAEARRAVARRELVPSVCPDCRREVAPSEGRLPFGAFTG